MGLAQAAVRVAGDLLRTGVVGVLFASHEGHHVGQDALEGSEGFAY